LPAGFGPSGLAVVPGAGGDRLAVINNTTPARLALIDPGAGTLLGTVGLAQPPVALAVSPDGAWAYVLEQDAGNNATVQAVDLARLAQTKAVTPGDPVPVGRNSSGLALSPSGRTLYVPFQDAGTPQRPGGVAVVDVSETDCEDILWDTIEGCPSCDHPDCVVLATVNGYHAGNALQDPTDPPSDPATDAQQGIARIDNRTGRHVLLSTQALYRLIECELSGAVGIPGPQGIQGIQGLKGDTGPGVEQGLTRIARTSWPHAGVVPTLSPVTRSAAQNRVQGRGLWVAFTGPVRPTDPTDPSRPVDPDHVFQVSVRRSTTAVLRNAWTPVGGVVIPVTVDASGRATEVDMTATPTPKPDTIAIFWGERDLAQLKGFDEFLVRLHGDFLLDANGLAVDAQFVRAQLPTGQRPAGGTFGIEGGVFESWFRIG
jgi:DNA-binding beta-propeller fold protein YncE